MSHLIKIWSDAEKLLDYYTHIYHITKSFIYLIVSKLSAKLKNKNTSNIKQKSKFLFNTQISPPFFGLKQQL